MTELNADLSLVKLTATVDGHSAELGHAISKPSSYDVQAKSCADATLQESFTDDKKQKRNILDQMEEISSFVGRLHGA